jgi:hypothetical protein
MDNGEGEDFVIRHYQMLPLLAMVVMAPVFAEELSRLFFDKQERQILNQKRSLVPPVAVQGAGPKITPSREPTASLEPTEPVPLPAPKVTGQVIRSSGNNTIWLNHNPRYKRGRK